MSSERCSSLSCDTVIWLYFCKWFGSRVAFVDLSCVPCASSGGSWVAPQGEREALGVTDMQLSLTSLEEVFLNIARKAEMEAAQGSGNVRGALGRRGGRWAVDAGGGPQGGSLHLLSVSGSLLSVVVVSVSEVHCLFWLCLYRKSTAWRHALPPRVDGCTRCVSQAALMCVVVVSISAHVCCGCVYPQTNAEHVLDDGRKLKIPLGAEWVQHPESGMFYKVRSGCALARTRTYTGGTDDGGLGQAVSGRRP